VLKLNRLSREDLEAVSLFEHFHWILFEFFFSSITDLHMSSQQWAHSSTIIQ
jgi:hypothetical protein